MVIVRRELRRVARIAGFGALTSSMLPAFLAHRAVTHERARDDLRDRWVGAWSSGLLRLFGVELVLRGAAPRAGRGRLVIANHRSTADILVLLRAFGGHVVSRADVAKWPLVGIAARSVGTLFVERSDARSGAKVLRTIRARLAEGSTVIVFPEGTTFPDDDVRPFHPGAFVAAARSGADLVPVGLAYAKSSGAAFVGESFPAHLARMAAAAPSQVAMCIGEPIATGEPVGASALRDRVRQDVQRLVHDARRLVDGTP